MKFKHITDDSRKVKKGSVFVAIKGEHFDAYNFIPEAISKGADVIVSESKPKIDWLKKVKYLKVKDARDKLSRLSSEFYGNPGNKLTLIGVTGTDGKTTTSHMIYEILKKAGRNVGLISTITSPGFHVTTPESLELYKILAKFVKQRKEFVVLEVTSHAIAQKRISPLKFEIAVITNITHEHLDYHKTFEKYRDTKLKLLQNAKVAVLNKDDRNYSYLYKNIHRKKLTYSLKENNLNLLKIMKKPIAEVGKYNVQNALAAYTTAKYFGINTADIIDALENMQPPIGRLEEIKNKLGIKVYIDFAHTPNALKQVLKLLKSQKTGRVVVVFGCAGERDVKKRPMMANIATELADVSIFTAEDPRSEDIKDIFSHMIKGVKNKQAKYFKIAERGEAIYFAIRKVAKKGDIVLIAGKSHENSMAYNGAEYDWSDFLAVRMALRGKVLKIARND